MRQTKDRLVHMGVCGKAHGIAGGFSLRLFNAQNTSLAKGAPVTLIPKDENSILAPEGESFKVKSVSTGGKGILYLEGIDDRNQVEAMIPFDLYMLRSDLPEPEEGEFYLEDLVGMRVVNSRGEEVGEVENYYDNGAQSVLRIRKKKGKIEL